MENNKNWWELAIDEGPEEGTRSLGSFDTLKEAREALLKESLINSGTIFIDEWDFRTKNPTGRSYSKNAILKDSFLDNCK